MIKLSVIIPYTHGDALRAGAYLQLTRCIQAQTMQDFEVIVVEQDMGNCAIPNFFSINNQRHIVVKDPKNRAFNKSWLVNIGIKNAQSENILMVDADSLFGKDYFQYGFDVMQNGSFGFWHGYNWIILLPGNDNPVTRVVRHKNIQSSGGTWWTTKEYFWDWLGGMNENYFGYGREDSDLWIRADDVNEHSGIPELNYPLTHQYHHWVVNDVKDAPEYRKNCQIWKNTKRDPQKIIDKLKQADLGNKEHPTLIDVEIY